MSKYNVLGVILCFGGLIMVLFQAISSMMTPGEIVWKSLSIVDIVDVEYLKWIDGISWDSIQKLLKYIATMPIYILLVSTGIISLIIGGLVKK